MAGNRPQSNFTHLKAHDEQLVRLGLLAERYFAEDPNTCLIKLRQLAELLAQLVASQIGLFTSPEEKQVDLLRCLQDQGIVPREVGVLFAEVRRAGKRFRQSVLAAAISGKLTEEWRASSGKSSDVRSLVFEEDSVAIPKHWHDYPLTELIDSQRPLCYGVVQPGKVATDGVPLVRVQDMERAL